jgi:hypothetical protein
MKVPPTYVGFRTAAAVICVLVLLLLGLGVAGNGPLSQLSGVTHDASNWLHLHWNPGEQQ